ncbi:hypothetical protein BECAL_00333 [Bellilinea caldifistulae]|uniref:Uncharacterized protein n=1 Tax=Bellilinea caldifistulae TaxID=360411 RepID=A0A0P6XNJ0_9CHLR|nr:hypothetical protein [Bellilinea caldifistulae]KPL78104.1 hypothetical protein AC812_01350 [Bellilinea caldifistulae]GAP09193.1 hypothetical protein BECAL_00333 [Bellilinea caldifistulae]
MGKLRIWLGLLAGFLILLAGCARATQPAPTATSEVPARPTAPAATATSQPQVNYCVECHTDKDRLIQTAKPEEEVIEESEGAG